MKKLERQEMKNLRGGLIAPGDIGGVGCLSRPTSGVTSCTCLPGDADGWCQSSGNTSSCYCLSDGSPACYTNGMSVCAAA